MFLRRKFSPGLSRAVNHLLRSLRGIQHATGMAADPDTATAMEKLDAALNNMSYGLCMFGPDNRLLLWNDRSVKMYKLALQIVCTAPGYPTRGAIGLSASPLRPLTRRPTSSCRACPAGNECPFPCR
jgi:PAS domain-containing protein